VNAAHVLARAERKGRLAPGYDADLVLLEGPDWRYLAYHLGGADVAAVVRGGRLAWSRGASTGDAAAPAAGAAA
jgi:imidazolonepropionase